MMQGWMQATAAAVVIVMGLAAAWGQTSAPAAGKAEAKPQLGMNLAGPADYSSELPWVDVAREARVWITQKQGAKWGSGPALALDKDGWVTKLDPDCWAETLMCTINGGHYPSGEYTVLYEGKGKVTFSGAARMVREEPGKITIKVDASQGAFFLQLRETDAADYVRQIRAIMPGHLESYEKEPWNPKFLALWKGVACFRFMDFMHTNGSKIATWEDRPTPATATYSWKGVPAEVMVDLCNREQADGWFCMPHLADDNYVREFAKLVKAKLDPQRKVYVEYSNEVWNGMFEQARYSTRKGQELGLGARERPWEGSAMYYAQRSVEIFKIWEEVLGKERLVRVLSWQAASGPYWTDGMLLARGETARHVDALAIAPYVTMCVPPTSQDPKTLSAEQVTGMSVEGVLDWAEQKALPESIGWIQAQKKVADKYGLKLVAYEGGQHLVGVGGGENNEEMTKLFQAANAHARMGRIYEQYLGAWSKEGGDLFCNFSSTGSWSKWGSWGLLQFQDEAPAASPKFMAVMRWAKACGQAVEVPK